MNHFDAWQRIEYSGRPVYIHSEKPDWFVPNDVADAFLQLYEGTGDITHAACRAAQAGKESLAANLIELRRLQRQVRAEPPPPYTGRAGHLELKSLKECWFHLTDTCNLACRHCLFAASPTASRAIDKELLRQGLRQARELGCTLFYFTGGEPFMYKDFPAIIKALLEDPAVHVVVLTNGMLLEEHIDALQALPMERLHLQISLDGLEESHERIRGTGTYKRLLTNLDCLQQAGIPATLSVAVSRANVAELPEIVSFAAGRGIRNVHFLWYFVRGKGTPEQFVEPDEILPWLVKAQEAADACSIFIDNVETIKSQVFSTPGTRYDLSNTAWESVAVGPDGSVYPSPALVDIAELNCGSLQEGLEKVWRHSPVLEKIRRATLVDSREYRANPLKFITGGGDIDHSYLAGGEFTGHDPYVELYNKLALWLITRQAEQYPSRRSPDILLRMGDVRYDCPDGGQGVSLTHCNCVISLSDDLGHSSVRQFYAQAAVAANVDIVNPFAPQQATASFIPEQSKQRSYGCGSPVSDAQVRAGEVLVDLGSGSGVECFMAAAEVGRAGKVYGIDMTDEMLDLARSSRQDVVRKLGYDNVKFIKGFLEDIPLPGSTADAVISNCVINLSPDKRGTFHEIFRILKPGGRMVVSDIVTDDPIPVEIKNNEQFRGECLGGALQQEYLMDMLRAAGFTGIRLIKRFPYRQEGDTLFYSLTFCAYKPEAEEQVDVVYRGPFAAVCTESGVLLHKGRRTVVSLSDVKSLDDSVFVLDRKGAVTNIQQENSCCAAPPSPGFTTLDTLGQASASGCCGIEPCLPEAPPKIVPLASFNNAESQAGPVEETRRHRSGCMVCGSELTYLRQENEISCYYCGGVKKTNAVCQEGHFICDDCHQQDGLSVIKLICGETKEQDMIALLQKIRRHPALPMHGPEHHAMVPGIILAAFRNRGGAISRETILTGIERGSKVPGGVCGFWGNCGAAAGVGIAFSVMLGATPLTPVSRQQVQGITARVLARIAGIKGARCCQRETVTALKEAAVFSKELLPVSLLAESDIVCTQFEKNKECIRRQCPLWQGNSRAGDVSGGANR